MKPKFSRRNPLHKNYEMYWSLESDKPDKFHKSKRYDKFREMPEVTKPIWAFDLAEFAMVLAAACAEQVHLWDLLMDPPELKVTLAAHKAHVWCVRFSPNETALATGSSDKKIRIWVAETGQPLQVLEAHTEGVRCLAFSMDGLLLSGGMDSQICLWEHSDNAPTAQWKAHEGHVHAIAFTKNYYSDHKNLALSVGADGSVAAWHVVSGQYQALGRFAGGGGGGILCVAQHTHEDLWCACGNEDGGVWCWHFKPPEIDEETGLAATEQTDIRGHVKLVGHKQGVRTLAFTPDGCLLASGSTDGMIRIWDVRKLHEPEHFVTALAVFKAHDSWVTELRFEGGDRGIVTSSSDGLVRHWVAPERLKQISRKFVAKKNDATEGGPSTAAAIGNSIKKWTMEGLDEDGDEDEQDWEQVKTLFFKDEATLHQLEGTGHEQEITMRPSDGLPEQPMSQSLEGSRPQGSPPSASPPSASPPPSVSPPIVSPPSGPSASPPMRAPPMPTREAPSVATATRSTWAASDKPPGRVPYAARHQGVLDPIGAKDMLKQATFQVVSAPRRGIPPKTLAPPPPGAAGSGGCSLAAGARPNAVASSTVDGTSTPLFGATVDGTSTPLFGATGEFPPRAQTPSFAH